MIDQGGVRLDGELVADKGLRMTSGTECIVQVGKRRFARVRIVPGA